MEKTRKRYFLYLQWEEAMILKKKCPPLIVTIISYVLIDFYSKSTRLSIEYIVFNFTITVCCYPVKAMFYLRGKTIILKYRQNYNFFGRSNGNKVL